MRYGKSEQYDVDNVEIRRAHNRKAARAARTMASRARDAAIRAMRLTDGLYRPYSQSARRAADESVRLAAEAVRAASFASSEWRVELAEPLISKAKASARRAERAARRACGLLRAECSPAWIDRLFRQPRRGRGARRHEAAIVRRARERAAKELG